ncbi:transposase family protein, partial [Nonomuraea sp. RK-328]|nr:transposase family protein [Nonomuraea sp. RK-328]
SRRALTFLSGLIRRHRKGIGSQWRRLSPGRQAMLTLVHLRKGETLTELAAGFAVGATTVWRYIREAIALLASRAPHLDRAVRAARHAGYAFVVLDGPLVLIDRVAADRPYYSGKLKKH